MLKSGRMRTVFLLLLAGSATAVICTRAEAGWPWDKQKERKQAARKTELRDVMKYPGAYANRYVSFRCRFAMRGRLFKHFNTPFNPAENENFAVWPLDVRLWEKAERRNVLPTLYIQKTGLKVVAALKSFKRYDVIEIEGRVVSPYAGLPWILVIKLKKVLPKKGDEDDQLTDTAVIYVKRGVALLENKKPRLAARYLEMSLKGGLPPVHKFFIYESLGECYFQANDFGKALSHFTTALGLKPNDPQLFLQLAKTRLRLKDPQGAIADCRQSLALSAAYPKVHALMGEAYGQLGQINKGLENCDLAINTPGIAPRIKAMAIVHRARVLIVGKRYSQAIQAYINATEEWGELAGKPWLRKEWGRLYESRFDEEGQAENLEEAILQYEHANTLSKNKDAEGLFLQARAEYKRGKADKDFARAKELLKMCLQLDPDYTPAKLLQGQISMAEGNAEAAGKMFDEVARAAGQDAKANLALAAAMVKLGKFSTAREAYQRALGLEPQNHQARLRYARLCEDMNLLTDARQSYAILVKNNPDDLGHQLDLGRVLLALGNYQAAAKHLKAAANEPGAQGEYALSLLGKSHILNGDYRKAEAAFRVVLQRNPNNQPALRDLARLLADSANNPAEAMVLAERIVAATPGDSAALDILGWAQVRTGRAAAGLSTLSKIPLEQMTRSSWYHLGAAKYATRDFSGALAALARVVSIPPGENEWAAEVAQLNAKARDMLEKVKKEQLKVQKRKIREDRRQRRVAQRAKRPARTRPDEEVEQSGDQTAAPLKVDTPGEESVKLPPVAAAESLPLIAPLPDWTEEPADEMTTPAEENTTEDDKTHDREVTSTARDGGKPDALDAADDQAADGIEIPGIVEPLGTPPQSSLIGPVPTKTNAVKNLPAAAVGVTDAAAIEVISEVEAALQEAKDSLASPEPREMAELVKLADKNRETSLRIPDPSQSKDKSASRWEIVEPLKAAPPKTPASATGEKPEKKKPALPKNDIQNLPDWAM